MFLHKAAFDLPGPAPDCRAQAVEADRLSVALSGAAVRTSALLDVEEATFSRLDLHIGVGRLILERHSAQSLFMLPSFLCTPGLVAA